MESLFQRLLEPYSSLARFSSFCLPKSFLFPVGSILSHFLLILYGKSLLPLDVFCIPIAPKLAFTFLWSPEPYVWETAYFSTSHSVPLENNASPPSQVPIAPWLQECSVNISCSCPWEAVDSQFFPVCHLLSWMGLHCSGPIPPFPDGL